MSQPEFDKVDMTTAPQLRVLFFDVFGTCVAQFNSVADELWKAAQEALKSDMSSMSSEVRTKAMEMVCPCPSTPVKVN
jgi:2-haloacid dehalogenase